MSKSKDNKKSKDKDNMYKDSKGKPLEAIKPSKVIKR